MLARCARESAPGMRRVVCWLAPPHTDQAGQRVQFLLPWSFSKLCARAGVAQAGWTSLQVGLRFRLSPPLFRRLCFRLCLRLFEGLLGPPHRPNLVGRGHQGPEPTATALPLLSLHFTHLQQLDLLIRGLQLLPDITQLLSVDTGFR